MSKNIQKINSTHLRSRHKHRAAPIVQRQNMSTMSAQRLERRRRGAVCHIDLAIARTAADQQARLVGAVLEEAQIAHRSVVHGQLDLFALQLLLLFVVAHQLDGLVIGTGGDEIALRRPRHAIDAALVVFGAFEQHRRLERGVLLTGGPPATIRYPLRDARL